MFVALTAIEDLWIKEEEVFFLGRWCLRNTSNIGNISYKILEYHWDDQNKVEKDNKYIFYTFQKFMPLLAKKLNKIHNTNLSDRYWEILVGVWYIKFIEVFFDRYNIVSGLKKYKNLKTYLTEDFITPKTFNHFYWLSQEDYYNFSIFSFLIKKMKINIEVLDKITNIKDYPSSVKDNINNFENNKFRYKKKSFIKKIYSLNFKVLKTKIKNYYIIKKYLIPFIKILIYYIKKPFSDYFNNYFFDLSLPISYKEKKNLYKKFSQIYNLSPIKIKPPNGSEIIDNSIREKSLEDFDSNLTDFENLIIKYSLKFIPSEYLENYNSNRNYYKKFIQKKIPIVTAIRCPLEYSTTSRYITAELSKNGSLILSCQEGGGMNVRKINNLDEDLNFIGCDYFMTWGWSPRNKKAIRSYMTKTFWLEKFNYNSNGHILVIGGSCRRYHWSVYEGQLNNFNKVHIKKNINFLKKLKKDILENIIYRFHVQYGENEVKSILDNLPNLKISLREDTSTDFYDLLYGSKLIINTSDYTANLQSLIINIPTLWYWDKSYHSMRDDSKKYYDILVDNEILFYDEEKFLNKIEEIIINPIDWWKSPNIQTARDKFCDNFCRDASNIDEEIFKLTKLITNNNQLNKI